MKTEHDINRSAEVTIVSANESPDPKRISWGAIIAGTVVALAAMIFLGLLGSGIGFWAVEPGRETDTVVGIAIGSAIYFIVTQIVALFAGGYVASHMSAAWLKQNAMLHGIVVWAMVTLLTLFLATSAVSSLFFNVSSIVKTSANSLVNATEALVPNELPDFSLPDIQMNDLPPRIQKALRRQGMTAENFKGEAREAFRNVISKQEQQAARNTATDTVMDIIRTPSDAMSDIDSAIDNLVGQGGVISAEDRTELMNVIERRTGITKSEAKALVEKWETRAETAFKDAQEELKAAQNEAIAYADSATTALASASFAAFIASLLGLLAAGIGATTGRREYHLHD